MFSETATEACTCAKDMPMSIAANSSPHRNSHDAALASSAKAEGSEIGRRLNVISGGALKSVTTESLALQRRVLSGVAVAQLAFTMRTQSILEMLNRSLAATAGSSATIARMMLSLRLRTRTESLAA